MIFCSTYSNANSANRMASGRFLRTVKVTFLAVHHPFGGGKSCWQVALLRLHKGHHVQKNPKDIHI